jgi:aspartate aminotransferase
VKLANRALALSISPTSKSRNRVRELARCGKVVNLAAGELDRTPPDVVLEALRTVPGNVNRYTETAGIPELRHAIARRMSASTGAEFTPDRVVVTTGAKQALFLTAMALFGPGDDVLVPSPAWGTLSAQIALTGATVVPVDTAATGFLPDVTSLERHRTSATRGVLLNTPNNPTGAVYPAEVIEEITRWAEEHDLWIVFDECYADLVFAPTVHVHPIQVRPQSADRVVTVGSFSKSFAVTGWRVGWLSGPDQVIGATKALQSHLTSHAPSVLQHALMPAALGAADEFVADSVRIQRDRLATAEQELAGTPHLRWQRPGGTFYLWLDCRELVGRECDGVRLDDDVILTGQLLASAQLACVAGSAFGAPGFLRLSLTVDDAQLRKALGGLKEFVSRVR